MRVFLVCFFFLSYSVYADTYNCNSDKPLADFGNFNNFQLVKERNNIILRATGSAGPSNQYYWKYTLLAENDLIGFRAFRSISQNANQVFDVTIGGEIQLIKDKDLSLIVSYVNAASKSGGLAVLKCVASK